MKGKPRLRRRSQDAKPKERVRLPPADDGAGRHQASPTAVAAEAIRTGVLPLSQGRRWGHKEMPREDDTIRVGDPDDRCLTNEYVGEETPGGNNPTPDQSNVDDIGRAYGLQEEDTGVLRSASEVLARRDRHRPELQPPGKPAP